MSSLWLSQLRQSARSLLRVPVFSLSVVASLGISVAALTAVFSVADAVLFRALPYRDPDELVWIASVRPQRSDAPFSLPEFMDYAARTRTVEIAAFTNWSAALATSSVSERLQGMRISANAFDVLGVRPAAGRVFHAADDRPGASRVVLLSHAFWQERFGGEPGIIGKAVRLNDQPYEVVGVLPRHFPIPLPHLDVVVPLAPEQDARRHLRNSVNFLRFFGRVRGTLAATERELSGIAGELRRQYPTEYVAKLGVAVTPMQEFLVGSTRRTFHVLLGAATVLLVTALANVLNLLLIRGVTRKGEVALRRALGGSGRQLAYGVTSEAALLSLAGALLGVVLAKWLVSLVASSDLGVLRLEEAQVAGRALILIVAITILSTLLFSVIQLAWALRSAPLRALSALGRGMHGSRGERRLRAAFLVTQLGFAVLLTIVTATMARSFTRLRAVDLGYRTDSVFSARLSLPAQKYADVAHLSRFAEDFEQGLRSEHGVVAAGAISIAPFSGNLAIIPFTIVGRPPAPGERLEAHYRVISPGYLAAVHAELRGGRDFARADNETSTRVAIISCALAERYFGESDPLGQQLLIDDNNDGPRPVTIVGVVEDMRHVSLDGPPTFDIYIPLAQTHRDYLGFVLGSQYWVVRLASGWDPQTFARVLAAIDRDVAVARVEPLRSYIDDELASRRVSVLTLLGFALVALVLATIGVYGVVAYTVKLRRREIGLRLALGATSLAVMRTFVGPIVGLAGIGAAVGVSGALLTRQAVAGLLFGVAPTEPLILGAVALFLVATSAIAAAIPARRAAELDPVIAMKSE
jgi:putative ABC transport system permease protein